MRLRLPGEEIPVVYEAGNNEAGLVDVTLSVFREGGQPLVTTQTMLDTGSGYYRSSFTPPGKGHYLAIVNSTSVPSKAVKTYVVGIDPDEDDVYAFYQAPMFMSGLTPSFTLKTAGNITLTSGSLSEINSEGVYVGNLGSIEDAFAFLYVTDGLGAETVETEVGVPSLEAQVLRDSGVDMSVGGFTVPDVVATLRDDKNKRPIVVAALKRG